MHIAIFGASGRVGYKVVAEALARGHTVTALVHNTSLGIDDPELHIVRGSVFDVSSVQLVLQRVDAVIVVLGSKQVAKGGAVIIESMSHYGISRIVALTGSAAFYRNDMPSPLQRLGRAGMTRLLGRQRVQNGDRLLELLANSMLAWTCLRSPAMLPFGGKRYRLSLQLRPFWGAVPRAAVATAIVDQLSDDTWLQNAPIITAHL